ncbi:SDR family NAD(P)-dependent oxidoreductase [Nitrosopumilus sp. S6]
MFEGKTILITGGSGSLGQALTKRLLTYDIKALRILSRNESNQVEMARKISDSRLSYFIGDIKDLPRLIRALEGVDIVFHTAALKHVPVIEYNPFEAIKTNVIGTQNVIDACLEQNVELVVGIGTDKAVSPLNTYGASKLLMEKLFVTAKNFLNPLRHKTKFITIRYGNVLGSSGSVVPILIEQILSKTDVTITDPNMTRFSITMDDALDFILSSAESGKGGEVFVPKLDAYTVDDVKTALFELLGKTNEKIIGIRPGEKMHETLIGEEEMRYAWEYRGSYVIFDPNIPENKILENYPEIKKLEQMEKYSSDNVEKIPKSDLKQILTDSKLIKPKS